MISQMLVWLKTTRVRVVRLAPSRARLGMFLPSETQYVIIYNI